MFQVAAFAALAGVSAKILRDYDQAGLFRPAWVDRSTRYRLYSPAQLPELRRILALRGLGVSLAEIRDLVIGGADLRAVLERRRLAVEQERRAAERRLASLGISLAAEGAGGGPDVVVRDVAAQLVAVMDVRAAGGDEGRAFYELELRVRDAGVRAARPPGTLVRHREPDRQPEVDVFVPIRRATPGLDARRLPQVHAATILHRGSYRSFDETRARLDGWIEAAGLVPADPLRILYLQFGAEEDLRLPGQFVVSRAADLLTEIQVPVG